MGSMAGRLGTVGIFIWQLRGKTGCRELMSILKRMRYIRLLTEGMVMEMGTKMRIRKLGLSMGLGS